MLACRRHVYTRDEPGLPKRPLLSLLPSSQVIIFKSNKKSGMTRKGLSRYWQHPVSQAASRMIIRVIANGGDRIARG